MKHERWQKFKELGLVLCSGILQTEEMWTMQHETWWDILHSYRTRHLLVLLQWCLKEKWVITSTLQGRVHQFSMSCGAKSLLIYHIKTLNNSSSIFLGRGGEMILTEVTQMYQIFAIVIPITFPFHCWYQCRNSQEPHPLTPLIQPNKHRQLAHTVKHISRFTLLLLHVPCFMLFASSVGDRLMHQACFKNGM